MLLFVQNKKKQSSLISVWKEVFGEDILTLEDDELNLLAKTCIAYVLNIVQWPSVFKMLGPIHKSIARISDDTPFNKYKDLRHELVKSTKTSLNLKLFILRLLVKEMNGDDLGIKKEAKACEVLPNDIAIWHNLAEMGLKPMAEAIINYEGFKVPLPSMVCQESAKFLIESQSYIESYTRKSLKFIYSSNRYDDIDLMGDLRVAATRAYYQKVPFLEGEHLKNCVRRTISNSGKKLIEYYTHPDRSRLLEVDSGKGTYTNRIAGEYKYVTIGQAIDTTNRLTGELDFSILIRGMKASHGKIISLLMMEDDTDFLKFTKTDADSCEELFNKTGRSGYYEHLSQYLKLPLSHIANVVGELRTAMVA